MTVKNEISIKPAGFNDIPVLVLHYHKMFKEIYGLQKIKINKKEFNEMYKNYREKLRVELKNGICKAWILKKSNKILASGAISIISMVPVLNDPSCKVAYLHSIYTEKKARGKGFAKQIVKKTIDYCKSEGIKRIILNTSGEGKSLYEKIGFQKSDNSMRFLVK